MHLTFESELPVSVINSAKLKHNFFSYLNSRSVSRGFLFRNNLLPIIRSLFSNSPM